MVVLKEIKEMDGRLLSLLSEYYGYKISNLDKAIKEAEKCGDYQLRERAYNSLFIGCDWRGVWSEEDYSLVANDLSNYNKPFPFKYGEIKNGNALSDATIVGIYVNPFFVAHQILFGQSYAQNMKDFFDTKIRLSSFYRNSEVFYSKLLKNSNTLNVYERHRFSLQNAIMSTSMKSCFVGFQDNMVGFACDNIRQVNKLVASVNTVEYKFPIKFYRNYRFSNGNVLKPIQGDTIFLPYRDSIELYKEYARSKTASIASA